MPEPLPRTPGIIAALILLATSSGLIDAVLYMRHGHVFAYAMTGNVVLLGVAISTGNLLEIGRHLSPILGFLCGVVAGKFMLRFHRAYSLPFAILLQVTLLTVAGSVASRLSSQLLVLGLAISGAVIITTIRRVGEIPFNITFMTGNLRSVFESAFDSVLPPSTAIPGKARQQFQIVGLACTGFLLGAALGAVSADRLQDHSFWIADLLFIAAGLLLRKVDTAAEITA